jgi:energy-coupling factor transporter ATP-binding protein EcfA2/ABC-type multidrug transport system permease subunit
LRLPADWSKGKKIAKAEEVLLKMGLKDCADNLFGNDITKGISGGEKRRVTIAVQILTDPHVILLDEPTSGLDAFTASSIMDMLRGLAEEGRTVILTIHQARSDLFPHFGNLLLLARGGEPVFSGNAKDMLPHFAANGHTCPQDTNPADFALDLITVDLRHEEWETVTRRKVRSLIESWNSESFARFRPPQEPREITLPAELGSFQKRMATFSRAFPLVAKRAFTNFSRQPDLMMGRIMQNIGFALILSVYFAPLKHDYFSVQTRLGLVQEIAPLYFIGMLQNVAVYPNEREVFYREYDDRAYSVETFLLQYTLIESAFTVTTALIFPALTVMAIGLHRTVQMYFIMAFNDFCIISCGESVGILFNTFFEHTGFAVNVTSVILSVAQIMGGTMSLNIPGFLQAFNYLSPIKYAVGNLASYTLTDITFTCNDFQRLSNGQCPIETGEQVLKEFNLDKNANMYLMGLGICTIAYRVIAYVVLKASRERWILKLWRRFKKDEQH